MSYAIANKIKIFYGVLNLEKDITTIKLKDNFGTINVGLFGITKYNVKILSFIDWFSQLNLFEYNANEYFDMPRIQNSEIAIGNLGGSAFRTFDAEDVYLETTNIQTSYSGIYGQVRRINCGEVPIRKGYKLWS